MYYSFQEQEDKRELLSMFGPKCSPRRGNALKRMFSHVETDSLGAETKTFPEKTENEKWYMVGDPLTIDRCSRIGFPLTFFAFNCIYWLVHSKNWHRGVTGKQPQTLRNRDKDVKDGQDLKPQVQSWDGFSDTKTMCTLVIFFTVMLDIQWFL